MASSLRASSSLFFLLVAAVVTAQQYNYGFDINKVLKRQAGTNTPYIVRGLDRINGSTPLRPEIRDLEKNFEKFTLFRLGTSMLQFSDQSEMLSWYKLSSIHGVPWESWNDVGPFNASTTRSGYCHHVSVLFPPWHRVYMALYEVLGPRDGADEAADGWGVSKSYTSASNSSRPCGATRRKGDDGKPPRSTSEFPTSTGPRGHPRARA